MTDSITAGNADVGKPDKRPLRQRAADRWNGLNVTSKAVVVSGVVLAVVGGLVLLADARASTDDPDQDDGDQGNGNTTLDREYVTQGTRALYARCSHGACIKKMRPSITGHDCCGRCETSRIRDCSEAAARSYDGPGSFPHDYFEGLLLPGSCVTCGEPPEGHWVLDGAATRLR